MSSILLTSIPSNTNCTKKTPQPTINLPSPSPLISNRMNPLNYNFSKNINPKTSVAKYIPHIANPKTTGVIQRIPSTYGGREIHGKDNDEQVALSVGNKRTGLGGHSAVILEGYWDSSNHHWYAMYDFFPANNNEFSYFNTKKIAGHVHKRTDEHAMSEFAQYNSFSTTTINQNQKQTCETWAQQQIETPPDYNLYTYNCSHWVRDFLQHANINISTPLFLSTPSNTVEALAEYQNQQQ